MKKIAKILSVVLCLALVMSFAIAVSAEETGMTEGFVASELGYENATAAENWYGEAISIEYDAGGNTNVPKYYTTGTAIRVYGKNSITISANEGYEIVSVTITTESSKPMNADNTALTNASATYSTTSTVLVPEYGTEAIVMSYTPSSGHWRIQGISVEYVGGYVEEITPPAGPVACQIPGNLEYTFATDDAATIGVLFQWTATENGELSVPRMTADFSVFTGVTINGGYDYDFGDNGYIVKAGDLVEITVYGSAAGAVSVPVEFFAAGSQGGATGTASNPEIITSLNAGVEKSLTEGEYYFQYTATKAGELKINTIGDGSHNLNVTVNGDKSVIYSNWDHDGAYVLLNVAEGDVLTLVVNFDFGYGTITFNSEFDAGENSGEVIDPITPPAETGDVIFAVLSVMAVSGLGLTAVASKKH